MHMATVTKRWTLDELHRLPDDGNKYELIDGELFVTPAPTPEHETILARLNRLLVLYVDAQKLGMVYQPRAVVCDGESEVEPDLMVRSEVRRGQEWQDAPPPLLVIEVLSPYTRRRDHMHKRYWYLRVGVGEYWIIDPADRDVRIIRPGAEDVVVTEMLRWYPAGAHVAFECHVDDIFGEKEP